MKLNGMEIQLVMKLVDEMKLDDVTCWNGKIKSKK